MPANSKKDGEPMRLRFGVGETFLFLNQLDKKSEVAFVGRSVVRKILQYHTVLLLLYEVWSKLGVLGVTARKASSYPQVVFVVQKYLLKCRSNWIDTKKSVGETTLRDTFV